MSKITAGPKVNLTLSNGERVQALSPLVLSISRASDVPAFYSQWLMQRLRAGYALWRNPFNQQKLYVSFEHARAAVFWSKNPRPLMEYLDELDELLPHYYFQFTLNDYEKEGLERGVPPLAERIETFRKLSLRIGPSRVIWRFDPILMLEGCGPRDILMKIWQLSKALKGCTEKLVISFADIKAYKKVGANLVRAGICRRGEEERLEPMDEQIEEMALGLAKIRQRHQEEGWDFEIATCAEQKDLSAYGITHNCCIDPLLLLRLFPQDEVLMRYIRYGELPRPLGEGQLVGLFDDQPDSTPEIELVRLKDKGQRKECGCMLSKDIGAFDTCPHQCVYCYATRSWASAQHNYELSRQPGLSSDSIRFESR